MLNRSPSLFCRRSTRNAALTSQVTKLTSEVTTLEKEVLALKENLKKKAKENTKTPQPEAHPQTINNSVEIEQLKTNLRVLMEENAARVEALLKERAEVTRQRDTLDQELKRATGELNKQLQAARSETHAVQSESQKQLQAHVSHIGQLESIKKDLEKKVEEMFAAHSIQGGSSTVTVVNER